MASLWPWISLHFRPTAVSWHSSTMCVAVVPRKEDGRGEILLASHNPWKQPQIHHQLGMTIRPLGLKNRADTKSPGQARLTYCNPALGLELEEGDHSKEGCGACYCCSLGWPWTICWVSDVCSDLVELFMPNPFRTNLLLWFFHLNEPEEVHI